MACFHPLAAWQLEDGKVVFVESGAIARALELPCGQCVGCRLERSRQWAVRCVHESQMHAYSVFLTLTYDDLRLKSMSLVYRDFQLFMKRLRKAKGKVRFYMCGEYGETYGRPHFHACVFGCFFEDREFFRKSPSGESIFTSVELSRLWPHGFSSIGDVTFNSAAYVARYVMKRVTGMNSENHYRVLDTDTGEVVDRIPEFTRMSLKPGIGATWFAKFREEVYGPRDAVVLNGISMRPPKYYDKLLAAQVFDVERWRWVTPFADRISDIEYGRFVRGELVGADNSNARLAVRESVTKSRLAFKKRSI